MNKKFFFDLIFIKEVHSKQYVKFKLNIIFGCSNRLSACII